MADPEPSAPNSLTCRRQRWDKGELDQTKKNMIRNNPDKSEFSNFCTGLSAPFDSKTTYSVEEGDSRVHKSYCEIYGEMYCEPKDTF